MTTDKNNNPNREIFVEKVTVNMGIGEAGEELENGLKILQLVTKKKPVKTMATVKLPTWGIRTWSANRWQGNFKRKRRS